MNNLIFRENSIELTDKEILCHLLTLTLPEKKVQEMSDKLLDAYGSLKMILETDFESLKTTTGKKTAELITSFLPLFRKYTMMETTQKISNRMDLEKYVKALLSGKKNEEFWLICVNSQCQVLGTRLISKGTLTEVNAYPRKIMETALNYNARSVFFCHNHPGGTMSPSAEDIQSTIRLKKMLNSVDITVLDHMILAGNCAYSMAMHGDVDFCKQIAL